jgi:hypothetical protein
MSPKGAVFVLVFEHRAPLRNFHVSGIRKYGNERNYHHEPRRNLHVLRILETSK